METNDTGIGYSPIGEGIVETPAPAPAPAPAAPAPAAEPVAKQPAVEPKQEEQPAPEPERQAVAPHELRVPDWLDEKQITDERQQAFGEFAQISADAGITREVAQEIVDLAVDGAVQLQYDFSDDTDRDDARSTIYSLFGEERGQNIIK